MLFAFLWVIPRRLNSIFRRFGTFCLFHLYRQIGVKNEIGLRNVGVIVREKVLFETSAYKIQTPGNYPEESTQHSEHGEKLKSRIFHVYGEETSRLFSSQAFSLIIPQHFSNLVHSTHTYLPMKMEQSVPKRRYIKFQTPGCYPKESTQQHLLCSLWLVVGG